MIQVIRSATLPWLSIDAVDEEYEDARLPVPKAEDVEKCLCCTEPDCTNCLDPSPKNRITGRRCGRPRKKRDSGQKKENRKMGENGVDIVELILEQQEG